MSDIAIPGMTEAQWQHEKLHLVASQRLFFVGIHLLGFGNGTGEGRNWLFETFFEYKFDKFFFSVHSPKDVLVMQTHNITKQNIT